MDYTNIFAILIYVFVSYNYIMSDLNQYLKDITAKDETKALKATKYMLDNADTDLFKMLADKANYLFDFIKDNVNKRIAKSATQDNYKNLLKFFDIYSQDFDDTFALILAQYADEQLTDEILELLESGSEAQKTYAAKYFIYIPDTIAIEALSSHIFSDSETLSYNAAQALGKMNDEDSFTRALEMLKSDDDFDKLKAVKFFVAYGQNAPIDEIFNAMKSSRMPENLAGEIPFLVSLASMLHSENKKNVLIAVENIISGLGEILPLSQVFQFELYDILNELININKEENHYKSKISQILLKSLLKFQMICKNDEYIFDEDKNTKQELMATLELLEKQTDAFWYDQKKSILKELTHCNHRVLSALEVIKDLKLKEASSEIKNLLNSENEIVICEVISTLKEIDELNTVNKSEVLGKLKSDNIKAIVENYWR